MERNSNEQELWEVRMVQTFTEDLQKLTSSKPREVVIGLVKKLSNGERWQPEGQDSTSTQLWKLAIEDTSLSGGHLIWWVELHLEGRSANQVMVLYRLCKPEDRLEVKNAAAEYLRTFSDAYLNECLTRKIDRDGKVTPRKWHVEEAFPVHRDGHPAESPEGRPVSLEKQYRLQQEHIALLIEHGLKNIQLPYVLDEDEENVLAQVCRAPVFLLGRSGSGKTTVLCHALFYLHAKPKEWFRDLKVGPVLLITRSKLLSSAIQKLFLQMCDSQGREHGPTAHGNLEVLEEDTHTFHKMPKSFKQEDMGDQKTLICHWQEFLLAADASLPPPYFFRHASESTLEKAQRQMRQEQMQQSRPGAERILDATKRFPHLTRLTPIDGFRELKNELSYEFFVKTFAPKLKKVLWDSDSLYVVYKEILTVITGSTRAVRSSAGCLSRREYVTGEDAEGNRLPESNDSAVKDEGYRDRIYLAFNEYQKLKKESSKYDRIDPVRHITQRAKEQGRRQRHDDCKMLAAIFIDEVQDLLPAEILLLRLFCPTNKGWCFAGDTAQTISKGVDFRFESIKRLFFEEFLSGKDWEADEVKEEWVQCTFCSNSFQQGTAFACPKGHMFNLCNETKCSKAFEKRLKDASKGQTSGSKWMQETAKGMNRESCPDCNMAMKEEKIQCVVNAAKNNGYPEEEEDQLYVSDYSKVPPIQHLTHNHRSSKGILEVAGEVIDLLVKLFPKRVDDLPREVSRVDTDQRPIFLNGLKIDELYDIIFHDVNSNEGSSRLFEFGAQQAVLVWSEQAEVDMKKRFPESTVLTIDHCKGLEFEDVLVMNPFSDMAEHGSLQRMWQFVLPEWQMGLDGSKHAELCAWLKHLYVAVTRARRRLWIVEEKADKGEPMMKVWQATVQAITSLEKAREARLTGFARTSSPQEMLAEGQRMLQHRDFLNAARWFHLAERAGLQVANRWRQYTHVKHLEQAIELLENGQEKRRKHGECAAQCLALSGQLSLGETVEDLTRDGAKFEAAEQFVQAWQLRKAAQIYEEIGMFHEAAPCYEKKEDWLKAGEAWRKANQQTLAMWDFSNGKHWEEFLSCAEQVYEDQQYLQAALLPKLVKNALRSIADSDADSNSEDVIRRMIRLLSQSCQQDEVDTFVAHVGSSKIELQYLQEQERFEEVSALCLRTCQWQRAYDSDMQWKSTSRSLLLGLLQELRDEGFPAELQQNPCYRQLCAGANLETSDEMIWEHVRRLEDGFESVESWERFWRFANQDAEQNGYCLLVQFLALRLAAKHVDKGAGRGSKIPVELIQNRMKEVDTKISLWLNMLQINDRSSHLPPEMERQLFEMLLVEQPDCVRPSYLIMGISRRFSYAQVLEHARRELTILQTNLHDDLLHQCLQRLSAMKPCKGHLWHGNCPANTRTACGSLHDWGPVDVQHFVDLVQLSFGAWTAARKMVDTSIFRSVLKDTPDATYWIDKTETDLLDACLPYPWQLSSLMPAHPTVIDVRDQLLRRAIDNLASELLSEAEKQNPRVQNLQNALERDRGVLLWCHLLDYHQVPSLRSALRKIRRKMKWLPTEFNLTRAVLTLLETQRESIPSLRLTKEATYDDLVNRFSFTMSAVRDLERLWTNTKDEEIVQYAPSMLLHLLEEAVCWANILITRFCNTTLPKSWVKRHLLGSEYLAALAAKNPLPTWRPNWRSWVIRELHKLVGVTANFVHDAKLRQWAKSHRELPSEVALRLYIIIFTCGTINWLREVRNDTIVPAVKQNLKNRLEAMNNFGSVSRWSLPRMFQWLVIGPPKDELVQVHDEEGGFKTRKFDQMTPWFHSVMCGLKDELVMLHRLDSQDAQAGWTFGQRTLNFRRFQHVSREDQQHLIDEAPRTYATLRPPEQVVISHPPVQRYVVFDPSWDACDFSSICDNTPNNIGPASASAEIPEFVLDKSTKTEDAAAVKVDEDAAEQLAVEQDELPEWIVDKIRCWLASSRAELQRIASASPVEQFCRASQLFLAKKKASQEQKATYFRVVPVLFVIQQDSASLKQLQLELQELKRSMGRPKMDHKPMQDLLQCLDLVEKMDCINQTFRKGHEQRILEEEEANSLDCCVDSFRRKRRDLRGNLREVLNRLQTQRSETDWSHHLQSDSDSEREYEDLRLQVASDGP